MQRVLILLLFHFVLFSCYDTGLDSLDISSENEIEYLNNLSDRNAFSNDPYKIIAITPRGNQWDVIVEYGGGCGDHLFYTWWDGQVYDSETSSLELFLIHNGNEDNCEALIRDTVSFSFRDATEYKITDDYVFVTVKNETNGQAIAVDPYLAELTNEFCSLNSVIVSGNCDFGAYGESWIMPKESIQGHRDILLQPVRAPQDDSFLRFKNQDIRVSVTALFGFEYVSDKDISSSCLNWSEGTVVPVALNCIEVL